VADNISAINLTQNYWSNFILRYNYISYLATFLSIGEFYFDFFNHLISNFIGRTIMIGYTWSVCFHTLNGIRHLGWDYGYGLDLSIVKVTGWSVVIGSLIMTIIIWFLSVL